LKRWLLDTDILSAFVPGKPGIPQSTAAWFDDQTERLCLSTITAAEIEAGIAELFRVGAAGRGNALRIRFEPILAIYADSVPSFDLAAAKLAGALSDAARSAGRHPGFADIAIAAIAKARELVVVTLNQRRFDPLGVEVFNPFVPQ
jgi:predicted nucleic acid-binding protein